MRESFHLGEFVGALTGAAAGSALAAGVVAALIAEAERIPHFAWAAFVAGGIGAALGGLLGAIVDSPATPNRGRVAALAAFIVSGLAAAPMQLLVFVMLFENWFDITPLVRGIAMFTGFMATVLVRLIGVLTGTVSFPGNPE